jgi:hypothetical protein
MNPGLGSPLDSIESAHDFVALMAETVIETKRELQADVLRESSSNFPRRLDALRMAQYSLQKLEFHLNRSHRILNDLRTLRRLLFEERTPSALKRRLMPTVKPAKPISSSSPEESHSVAKPQNSVAP